MAPLLTIFSNSSHPLSPRLPPAWVLLLGGLCLVLGVTSLFWEQRARLSLLRNRAEIGPTASSRITSFLLIVYAIIQNAEDCGVMPLVPVIVEVLTLALAVEFVRLSRKRARARKIVSQRPIATTNDAAIALSAGRQWPELLALVEGGGGTMTPDESATARRQALLGMRRWDEASSILLVGLSEDPLRPGYPEPREFRIFRAHLNWLPRRWHRWIAAAAGVLVATAIVALVLRARTKQSPTGLALFVIMCFIIVQWLAAIAVLPDRFLNVSPTAPPDNELIERVQAGLVAAGTPNLAELVGLAFRKRVSDASADLASGK